MALANPSDVLSKNIRWWDEDENDVHDAVQTVWLHIRATQAWRRDRDDYHVSLYGGSPVAGISRGQTDHLVYEPSTLPYNVARSATDTLVAKIAKHRPLPVVLASKGNWKQKKRARKMSQYLDGVFYQQRIFEKRAKLIVRDAAITGRGALKIWAEGKRIMAERAHGWELWTDNWDAHYGDPQNLYHARTMDRNVVLNRYGKKDDGSYDEEKKEAIMSASPVAGGPWAYEDSPYLYDRGDPTVDRVHVVEAWHLPSGPDEEDGRHVITIHGATLVDEPWTFDYFPFAILQYSEPVVGYWGQGLVEQVEGYQANINQMSLKLEDAHNRLGGAWVVTDDDSISDQWFNNELGTVLRKKPGRTIDVINPTPVHPQTYQRHRDLMTDALADAGLSQMSARSEKPADIQSGIALQTLDDIETERFMVFGRAYESWCVDVARMFIDCARAIAEEYGDYAIAVPLKGGLLDLSWKDVEIDGFELQPFNSSVLPSQPAARLDKLMQLFNAGLIERTTLFRELQSPDLQSELDLQTAQQLNVDERIEAMLDAEDPSDPRAYKMPTPYQDLSWAIQRADQRLCQAESDGCPDENLDLVRRFIDDAQALLAKKAANNNAAPPPPAMPGAPPPPNGPQAPPGAPPMTPPNGAPPIAA